MENATPEKEALKSNSSESGSFLGSFFTLIFWLGIICTFLWNWDGFWQTDIKSLNSIQKSYLSNKYTEEQLKISRVTRNNEIISDVEARVSKYEKLAAEARESERLAEEQLNNYLGQENEKCEYYNTSLLIIKNISRKLSTDELSQLVRCTNTECEEIINSKPKAFSICD